MEQKAVSVDVSRGPDISELNDLLSKGWLVKFMSNSHVAIGGQTYNNVNGKILVILERTK